MKWGRGCEEWPWEGSPSGGSLAVCRDEGRRVIGRMTCPRIDDEVRCEVALWCFFCVPNQEASQPLELVEL